MFFNKPYSVAFFGHRYLDDLRKVEERLTPIVAGLLRSKEYVELNIGRDGEFDEFAASVIKRTRRDMDTNNSALTLVLPYMKSKLEDYEKYYDEIVIPEPCYNKHYKAAITERNKWMVEQADLVVVFVKKGSGGAYTAMKCAEKLEKQIINLASDDFEGHLLTQK